MSVWVIATAGLAFGALGSLHCAGMCGPLAVAGCSKGRGIDGAWGYFIGRFVAYATLGAIVGHLGKHAFCILPVSAANAAAVGLMALPAFWRGISLLLKKPASDVIPLRKKPLDEPHCKSSASSSGAPRSGLLSSVIAMVPRRGLGLGLATGVLPCGLLFSALAMAAATSNPSAGAMSMAAFSIGSAPGLLIPLFGRQVFHKLRVRIPIKVEGLLWCGLAIWLFVRLAMGEQGCHTGMAPV